jgi:hypothetical protein
LMDMGVDIDDIDNYMWVVVKLRSLFIL